MSSRRPSFSHRPRELRRRVVLPARLRTGAQWSDTCILNISSRGLMIYSGKPAPKGSLVEVRRGEHVIIARVAWREGARVGLCAEDRVLIEQITSVGHSQAFRLTAPDVSLIERRRQPRPVPIDARLQGRALEFLAAGAIAASLAGGAWAMTEQAFARPLGEVSAALGRQS